MPRHSSSTSNSDSASTSTTEPTAAQAPKRTTAQNAKQVVWTVLWVVGFLVLGDIALNVVFRFPDVKKGKPNALQTFFDRGRSMESKLRRNVLKDWASPGSRHGWLNRDYWKGKLPSQRNEGTDRMITLYGMSFSNHIGDALEKIDDRITIRRVHAAAAPPNHSFTAYMMDRENHESDVVVLGVLASSVPYMATMTSLTWRFDVLNGYSYPMYHVEAADDHDVGAAPDGNGDGKLIATWPKVRNLDELRGALNDKGKWDAYMAQLEEHDRFYSPVLMSQCITDKSALMRLLRRAYSVSTQHSAMATIHDRKGYKMDTPIVPALRKMIRQFAATAKKDGRVPVVLLFHDQGYSDHLFQALAPTLETFEIPYVSTHSIRPATDRGNFIADGHFTPEADRDIAQAVLDVVEQQRKTAMSD